MLSFIRGFLSATILLATGAGAGLADPVDPADPYALDRSDPASVARAYVRAVKAADFAFAYGLVDPQWRTAEAPEPGSEKAAVTQLWGGPGVAECFRVAHSAKLTLSHNAESGRYGAVFGRHTDPTGFREIACVLTLTSEEDHWYVYRVISMPASFLGSLVN